MKLTAGVNAGIVRGSAFAAVTISSSDERSERSMMFRAATTMLLERVRVAHAAEPAQWSLRRASRSEPNLGPSFGQARLSTVRT